MNKKKKRGQVSSWLHKKSFQKATHLKPIIGSSVMPPDLPWKVFKKKNHPNQALQPPSEKGELLMSPFDKLRVTNQITSSPL